MGAKMKYIVTLLSAGLALTLTACDGDIAKSVAREVLKDELNKPEQTTTQQPTQQVLQPVNGQEQTAQLQPVQPVQPVVQQPEQVAPVSAAPSPQPVGVAPATQPMQTAQPVPRQTAKPVRQTAVQYEEYPVNLPATVITRYGGNVIVRNSPSRRGRQLGYLYTSEDIWVIAQTNKCETIQGIHNCWVRVRDSVGLTGYSFGGYLDY